MIPLVLTNDRVPKLWEELEVFPALRRQLGMDTPERFWAQLTSGDNLFWNGGMAFMAALRVRPSQDADVFFAAFDRKLKEHDEDFRSALRQLFRLGALRRVTTYTPASMAGVQKMLGRLGFRWEGVLRHGWPWDGDHADLHVNGLLREELGSAQPVVFVAPMRENGTGEVVDHGE